jgi:hypothetical protein
MEVFVTLVGAAAVIVASVLPIFVKDWLRRRNQKRNAIK